MLTVPEAARRVNRNPETIRRWIRTGRLPTRKIGIQHIIEESDLLDVLGPERLPLPAEWQETFAGEPTPDIVAWIRRSRARR